MAGKKGGKARHFRVKTRIVHQRKTSARTTQTGRRTQDAAVAPLPRTVRHLHFERAAENLVS